MEYPSTPLILWIFKFIQMPSLKAFLAKAYAAIIYKKINKWSSKPLETQNHVFQSLISEAVSTNFGVDHDFISIKSYEDFVNRVPVRDYEALRPYVDKVVAGESNVLWKGSLIIESSFRSQYI